LKIVIILRQNLLDTDILLYKEYVSHRRASTGSQIRLAAPKPLPAVHTAKGTKGTKQKVKSLSTSRVEEVSFNKSKPNKSVFLYTTYGWV
jgi:hypothetical protein